MNHSEKEKEEKEKIQAIMTSLNLVAIDSKVIFDIVAKYQDDLNQTFIKFKTNSMSMNSEKKKEHKFVFVLNSEDKKKLKEASINLKTNLQLAKESSQIDLLKRHLHPGYNDRLIYLGKVQRAVDNLEKQINTIEDNISFVLDDTPITNKTSANIAAIDEYERNIVDIYWSSYNYNKNVGLAIKLLNSLMNYHDYRTSGGRRKRTRRARTHRRRTHRKRTHRK